MNEEDIIRQNPWFKDASLVHNDPDLKKLDDARIKWEPRIARYFEFGKNIVYTVRGPRQVGKTTLVKSMIRRLLQEEGVDPLCVFYFSLDLLDDPVKLAELITAFYDLSSRFGAGGRKYVFLDEISNVKGWEKALKHIVDTGRGKDTIFILTGSHSLDIKNAVERLPGRRGEGGDTVLDKILMPMKFSEYVETVDRGLSRGLSRVLRTKKEKRASIFDRLFKGEIDPLLSREPVLFSDELDKALQNYLLTGGIPRPINEFGDNANIENGIYSIYVNSLAGDLARWGMSERIAKQVIRSVIEKMTTRISINSIAKENEIGSHNTVMKYLDALESAFVLNTFYQIDITSKRLKNRSEKKIYITDPFIFHSMRSWVYGFHNPFSESMDFNANPEGMSKMIEMIVSNHLIRLAYGRNPTELFSHHESVAFWRKKGKEKEVDFVLRMNGELYPVEVKYTNQIRKRDLGGIFNFGRGLILTKKEMKIERNYVYLPVKYFLLLV